MIKKGFIGIYIYALLSASSVHATSGWTDFTTVAELVPSTLHYYEARIPVKENPSGCKEKTWFYQDYAAPGSDKIFQVLLESIKSGKQVRIFVSGRCNLNGYSEISSVSIIQ